MLPKLTRSARDVGEPGKSDDKQATDTRSRHSWARDDNKGLYEKPQRKRLHKADVGARQQVGGRMSSSPCANIGYQAPRTTSSID